MSARGTAAARPAPDRAAAVRAALRTLVAQRGFHGASMSAVAERAGVATGTAYVHYESKDALVLAAYLETKAELGAAATAPVDPSAAPRERFISLWRAAFRHLAGDRETARFLIQVEGSPYAEPAHAAAIGRDDDPLVLAAAEPDMAELLLPLPQEVLYELGLAPAVRLAARGIELAPEQLELIAAGCWRAISR